LEVEIVRHFPPDVESKGSLSRLQEKNHEGMTTRRNWSKNHGGLMSEARGLFVVPSSRCGSLVP